MPRKTNNNRTNKEAEPMPFQARDYHPHESLFDIMPLRLRMAKASLPIFGGTGPTGDGGSTTTETKTEDKKDEKPVEKKTTTVIEKPATGGDGETDVTQMTPEQISDLLANVTSLTAKVDAVTKENETFKTKEEEGRRAKQDTVDNLTEDLTKAQQIIDQQDQVIKRLAVVNAIQGNKDLQFHNVNDAISRLGDADYELSVDLENGTATVKGLEAKLKEIAKNEDYLVVKPTLENNNNLQSNGRPRASGNPPSPNGNVNQTKAQRRSELEAKWPVIGRGQPMR